MKTYISIVCAVIISLFVSHSIAKGQNNKIYKIAIKHLSKKYARQGMVVSKALVDHQFVDFYKQLSEYWTKSEQETIKILDSLDMLKFSPKELITDSNGSTHSKDKQGKIIFLSSVVKNMMSAEVFDYKGSLNYHLYTTLNASDKYLFVLSDKHKILKIFKGGLQYE